MRLSRHVKNNMKLYGIAAEDIEKTVREPDTAGTEGGKTVALRKFGRRFLGYPLKVVYEKTGAEEFVITAYPIKRKMWR
jgi:hypothetical protein